ncbi:nucleotidyltransferase [Ornithinimicrobium cavernae]|uniref:nucleotidyltransferase n=1 Tax=Ornithinimicrobium cavernae TaxID=2666047 RepID=UPI000D68A05E|nr:nucleotidyltransferase [Ornithinimicrobium cavernae]
MLGAVGRGADHHGDPVDFLIETSVELSGIDTLTLSRRLEALLGSEVGLTQLGDLGGHSRARALDDSTLL